MQMGSVPEFFTGGSTQFPTSPCTRYAAFAVLWDLACHDHERCQIADLSRYDTGFTNSFLKLAAALCQGEQDILRAELSAIANVCENWTSGRIYSDGQGALHLAELALKAPCVGAFAGKEHFDILLRIWNRRHLLSFELCKVKSHRDLGAIRDPLTRNRCMGNWYADKLAEEIRDSFSPSLVQEHLAAHADLEREKGLLFAVYKLHLALLEARGRAEVPEVAEDMPVHEHDSTWQHFRTWTVAHSAFVMQEPERKFLAHSSFGRDFAEVTIDWLQQISWPRDGETPLESHTGTSWIELALSWMCFNRRYLPILRQNVEGQTRVLVLANQNDAQEHHLTFTECGTMLEKLLGNTQALTPQILVPKFKRQKTSTLYHLGSSKCYQGKHCRPQLPCQHEIFDILHDILAGAKTGTGLTGVPCIATSGGSFEILEGSWDNRSRLAVNAMHKVRAFRKTI